MDFEVDRSDYRKVRVVDRPSAPLGEGQIRLAVERFALTSNNITYAVVGDMLDYWSFYPTEDGWGRVPAMGLGTIIESAHDEIATGGRFYGWYPMSDEVVFSARASSSGFRDVGEHRANHAPTYVRFVDVATDPAFRDEHADEYLLFRGLFMTSWLIDDLLADNDDFGAAQVLVTSASSKTSISLAHCLAARGIASVGLTSARNLDFVRGLGVYGSVVTYDEIAGLDAAVPSVSVDMAGDSSVLRAIHERFGELLGYSSLVGATHWEQRGGGGGPLPGPKPELFFAPGQVQKRAAELGKEVLEQRMTDAFLAFVDASSRWLQIERGSGPDAVMKVYEQLVDGTASPARGSILSMRPDAFA